MTDGDPDLENADGPTLKQHAGELYGSGDYANAEAFLQRAIDKGDLPADDLAKAYHDMGLCRGQQSDAQGAYQYFYQALTVSSHYANDLGAYMWFFWAATGGTWPNGVSQP